MGDRTVIMPYEENVLYKANSGSARFQIRTEGNGVEITLVAKEDLSTQLFRIVLGPGTKVINLFEQTVKVFNTETFTSFQEFREIWLSWYNSKIQIGLVGEQKPLVVYDINLSKNKIGFIQFKSVCRHSARVEWIIETSPVMLKTVSCQRFEERLHWCPLINGKLPLDAMIGGFENEVTYIARSNHNNSRCPGKYVPSTGLAYVAWGGREHAKQEFEILCGFNGQWLKTIANFIPPNAFIAGESEVRNDPLYIGRAILEGKLVPGKVHVRYNLCYLPFNGKEVEVSKYEILVIPDNKIQQALFDQ